MLFFFELPEGIGKHKVVGMVTDEYHILAGYSDSTVRLWDHRNAKKEQDFWDGRFPQGRTRTISNSSNLSSKSADFAVKLQTKKSRPELSFNRKLFFAGSLSQSLKILFYRNLSIFYVVF